MQNQEGGGQNEKLGDLGQMAEAASPISSRPPPSGINFEAGGGGEGSSNNRWPRQETLALLQIRSQMDVAFRDATLKAPLWEQVSRKLAELGYKRSAEKCKEKFENVHKYYKRTKEGRGGRQDGKSYKFFSQLEALHHNINTDTSVPASSVPVSLPPPSIFPPPHQYRTRDMPSMSLFDTVGISFSSNGSSSSSEGESDDDDDLDQEMEIESADQHQHQQHRKRKRGDGGKASNFDSDKKMMDLFEGLIKQVMQKQEAMQQKFIEVIEKREQDRMIREEAWKRQDMARLAREHDVMAQERAVSASRDTAIIAFLQKFTGQTIHLPTTTVNPQNIPSTLIIPPVSLPAHSEPQQHQSENKNHQRSQFDQPVVPSHAQQCQTIEALEAVHKPNSASDQIIVTVTPTEQMSLQDYTGGGSSSLETTSSRWPKAEVLALIQLRSGLEYRYQEVGPKGQLWEEISVGMQRMGYNRNAKRCKEKWENINKYFKKVKESNKKRPEDSKTCPYFNELDALYQKKVLGNSSGNVIVGGGGISSGVTGTLSEQERQRQDAGMLQSSSTHLGEQSQAEIGGAKQPEDMLKRQHKESRGDMTSDCCNKINFSNIDDINHMEDEVNYEEVDENEDYDDKTDEEMKMGYKIQFQRPNVGSSSGGGATSTSFMAMVQ